MAIILGQHDYFGEVTGDRTTIFAEGPIYQGKRLPLHIVTACEIENERIFMPDADEAIYHRLQPLLAEFQRFCERLTEKEAVSRQYFAREWPKSAGAFELESLTLVEEGVDWQGKPDFSFLRDGPFGLQYKALDADAWTYAGNVNWPPQFRVVFSETGDLVSVEPEVDARYKELPAEIEPVRNADGYYHPYFGDCEMDELATLKTIKVAGRDVDIDLYMKRKAHGRFEPSQLDTFVPLIENLDAMDAQVRADFPEQQRIYWLGDRMDFEPDERTDALRKMFPGAKTSEEVAPSAFAKALWLDRICLSLSPEGSDGAALTLDYLIFPIEEDGEVFAARFDAAGKLMDIVIES